MTVCCREVIDYLEQLAPTAWAEEWDNVGLQLGNPNQRVQKILVALDLNPLVVQEALDLEVEMIITHHPLFFHPLKNLRSDQPLGNLIYHLIRQNIAVYASHTNLDIAQGGVNTVLAELIELQQPKPLQITGVDELCKLVVFVPQDYARSVHAAISQAGAGWIGHYADCAFQVQGEGMFRPLAGTNPFIGQIGQLERVPEVRIETILPKSLYSPVLKAMLAAHPYEEVAYDVYPLYNQGQKRGLGRIGYLREPLTLKELGDLVKKRLKLPHIMVTGELECEVSCLALCGGSGASLIPTAAAQGAQVLITGDVKYHEAQLAQSLGLAIIDAGHEGTEKVIVPRLVSYLREYPVLKKAGVEVIATTIQEPIWQVR